MSDLRALRTFARSMSPLPGMPDSEPRPPQGRGTCASCGGGTYKGRSTCAKCDVLQAARAAREQRAARRVPVQHRPVAPCWICGKPTTGRPRADGRQPTCSACTRQYGAGVCSECGGPKRLAKPGLCRTCRPVQPKLSARACELCQESYVPKYRFQAARPQRFCSKSCTRAWQNGARPPYERQAVTGMARKVALARERRLRHAQTWDGITDEEILDRDGWRCQIPGCKRRPIRKDVKYPHLRSKSIDHIVPLSLGGDDTAVNKRAAHLGCNMARGNEMGDEQIALFGSVREPPLVTRTHNGVTVRPAKPPRLCCVCGEEAPLKGSKFCQCCRDQRAHDVETRRQALTDKRSSAAEQTATLHAEIRRLRAQGFTTRAVAAYLGTSPRMVTRVDLADPVTGKLPR